MSLRGSLRVRGARWWAGCGEREARGFAASPRFDRVSSKSVALAALWDRDQGVSRESSESAVVTRLTHVDVHEHEITDSIHGENGLRHP